MNKSKILMLASVASTIEQFNMDNINLLMDMGYDVEVACNFIKGSNISDEDVKIFQKRLKDLGVVYHHIDFDRNALNIKQDIIAVKQVKKLVREQGYYAIHCHTPIGAVAGRLAGKSAKIKVIYTAHGFHFYKGAPVLNWILFYPIEKWLSNYTDMLITMNEEDKVCAITKFHAKKNSFIHGVGVDIQSFSKPITKNETFTILSVGELNENKNHETVIKALANIKELEWQYLICGKGNKDKELIELTKSCGIEDKVSLLGYRNDVKDFYEKSDVFVFPSFREGLSVALMEAMAAGLPVVASNIRGNRDLIQNGKGGILVSPNDSLAFADAIKTMILDENRRLEMSSFNLEYIKKYDINAVHEEMRSIYNEVLKE